MQWFAQAPSNIALIKYMGKKDTQNNIPINDSLSYTLKHLLTSVTLETQSGTQDIWEPLELPGAISFALSRSDQKRFLNHLYYLKSIYNYTGGFIVRSVNNFPKSSGFASSASSFAALTQCAILALSALTDQPLPSIDQQASWSRLGSGSSCRSFYTPWALWQDTTVTAITLPYIELLHQAVIVSHNEKQISSTQAHSLIKTSPHYIGRSERANQRLKLLLQALQVELWAEAYNIIWDEFQDMHHLFATCSDPFTYTTADGLRLLQQLQEIWDKQGDGPLITMDAGPNIHLLYRPNQVELAQQIKCDYLLGNFDVV